MTGIYSLAGFRAQQSVVQRISDQQVQYRSQVGKIEIITASAADETLATIKFTLVFVDEPTFTFGAALETNQTYTPGKMPTASAIVVDWQTYVQGPTTSYLGARLGVVTTGEAGKKIWLHYSFAGQALSFPAGPTPSNGTGNA